MLLRVLDRNYRQDMTYWPPMVDSTGRFVPNPDARETQYRCRWQDSDRRYQDDTGESFVAEARVYLPFVPREGGFIALGRSRPVEDALQIAILRRSPSLDGRTELVSVILRRQ